MTYKMLRKIRNECIGDCFNPVYTTTDQTLSCYSTSGNVHLPTLLGPTVLKLGREKRTVYHPYIYARKVI